MTRDLFDDKKYMASLAYDEELAAELIDAFLQDAPERVRQLSAALEADDAATATKLSHSLKGMCGVVRADRLARLSLEMEYAGRDGRLGSVRESFASFVDALDQASALMTAFKRGI